MRSPDKHLQELVTRLLFLPDNPVAADATLVLGMSLWQSPLKAAVRLFRGGSAGTLVFSGGDVTEPIRRAFEQMQPVVIDAMAAGWLTGERSTHEAALLDVVGQFLDVRNGHQGEDFRQGMCLKFFHGPSKSPNHQPA